MALPAIAGYTNPWAVAAITMAGSLVDNYLLMPTLFPQDAPQDAAAGDVRIQGVQEGHPRTFCLGPENRVPGTVVWAKENLTLKTDIVGGKGGPGQSQTISRFFTNVVWAGCSAPDGGIVEFTEVILDGKGLFNAETTLSFTGHEIGVGQMGWFNPAPYAFNFTLTWVEDTPGSMGDQFNQIEAGKSITVSGMPDTVMNDTYTVTYVGELGGTFPDLGRRYFVTNYGDSNPLGVGYPAADGSSFTGGTALSPALFEQISPPFATTAAEAIEFNLGTDVQPPWSVVEEQEGFGNTPAFRRTATCMMRDLALYDYGNRIPNAEFIIKAHEEITVADAIRALVNKFVVNPPSMDTTGVSDDQLVRGYSVRGRQSIGQMLQPLLLFYDIVVAEIDGRLVFRDRDNLPEWDLHARFLGAHEPGQEDYVRNVSIVEEAEIRQPGRVEVSFRDPEVRYVQGSTGERRPGYPSDQVVQVSLDTLVVTEQEARDLARRLLWSVPDNAREMTISLPPSQQHVTPASVLSFTARGKTWKMLVKSVDRGAENYALIVKGIAYNPGVYGIPSSPTEQGGAATGSGGTIYTPPPTQLEVFETAPLFVGHEDTPRFYYAIASLHYEGEWRSAALFEDGDPLDGTFASIDSGLPEATMGTCSTTLGDGTPMIFNPDATVDVILTNGSAESVSLEELYSGQNRALIGDEVVGFLTAELIANATYRLTGMLRGLRNTAVEIGSHGASERFIVIDTSVEDTTVSAGTNGLSYEYKGVSSGADVDDFTAVAHTRTLKNLQHFEPCDVQGKQIGGSDMEITWNRRARAFHDLWAVSDPPLGAPSEGYDVEIYAGTPANPDAVSPARTVQVANPDYTYTEADQITDGNTTNPFTVRVRQIGDGTTSLTSEWSDDDLPTLP